MSMTIKQAIENRERCYKYLIGCGPKATTENLEAVRLSLEALKKQLQQKPIPHKVDVDAIKIGNAKWCKGTTVYKCPCCGSFISRLYEFCFKCGQALKWEE